MEDSIGISFLVQNKTNSDHRDALIFSTPPSHFEQKRLKKWLAFRVLEVRNYYGITAELPRIYRGITTELSWNYLGIIMELPWSYHWITKELPWNYHGITKELPRNYHGITAELPWNYRRIIAELPVEVPITGGQMIWALFIFSERKSKQFIFW